MCTERIGEGTFGTVNQCRYYTAFEPFIAEKQIYCPSTEGWKDNIELHFMRTYCSTSFYSAYFASLLYWMVQPSQTHPDKDIITFGLKYYKMTLATYFNNDEVDFNFIHKRVWAAIEKLHEKGYAHLDIKPENILLNVAGTEITDIVLADFGQVKPLNDQSIVNVNSGTIFYMVGAPNRGEKVNLSEFGKFRDKWAWAMSLLLYMQPLDVRKKLPINEYTSPYLFGVKMFPPLPQMQNNEQAVDFINATITEFNTYYTQQEKHLGAQPGGGAAMYVTYNNRVYTVRQSKVTERHIIVAKQKVPLSSIRGKYRYVRS